MPVTRVIAPYDDPTPDQANVDELEAVLQLITDDQKRWEQGRFCQVPEGVDDITEDHLAAGVYHDFVLSPEVVEALRDRWRNLYAPVANCGTALCVAGHVSVRNGWTFIARTGEDSASRVVPTSQVDLLLKHGCYSDEVDTKESADVAREVLNVPHSEASALFAGGNNLVDLWALGYAITGGRLKLPTSLPEGKKSWSDTPITNALPTADDVLDAIHLDLAIQAYYRQYRHHARYVDAARVLPLLADTTEARQRRAFLLPYTTAGMRDIEFEWITNFIQDVQPA